jgi:alkylation response protein AidB-like acyl-CoA dehydrogenase
MNNVFLVYHIVADFPHGTCHINVGFFEEERTVRRTTRKFAENEIAPVACHHEETGEWPE